MQKNQKQIRFEELFKRSLSHETFTYVLSLYSCAPVAKALQFMKNNAYLQCGKIYI